VVYINLEQEQKSPDLRSLVVGISVQVDCLLLSSNQYKTSSCRE